jgi:hypothetical protein
MAAVVLIRGLVLLVAPLLALTPFAIFGTGLAALLPALLVLMWLRASGDARRAFAVAIAAAALGALADALTPSYDASPLWSWIGNGLTVASELAILGGFAFLAPRMTVTVLGVGTALSLARLVLPDVFVLRVAAPLVLALGHFLLFPALRKKTAVSEEGLFGWSLAELGRFAVLAVALVIPLAVRFDDRELLLYGAGVTALCALLAAIGARTRAVPLAGIVVTVTIVADLAEAWLAGRDAALARAGVKAAVAALLVPIGVWTLARAVPRRGPALGIFSWALAATPAALLLVALAELVANWDTRRTLNVVAVLLLLGFAVAWLGTVLICAVKLRAHRAPGGVGEEVAKGA